MFGETRDEWARSRVSILVHLAGLIYGTPEWLAGIFLLICAVVCCMLSRPVMPGFRLPINTPLTRPNAPRVFHTLGGGNRNSSGRLRNEADTKSECTRAAALGEGSGCGFRGNVPTRPGLF